MTAINALNDAICEATGLTPQDVGVSIGRWEDRTTWKALFIIEATDEQIKAAQSVIDQFDPTSIVETPPRDALAELDALREALTRNDPAFQFAEVAKP